ncbi:MAG: hypothetical protein E2O29_01690 [Deltaproteobacteria bacterium]|nr:MAG: hypothetical protein E2O29_01690 [Deltaproteobacteria bacterium]
MITNDQIRDRIRTIEAVGSGVDKWPDVQISVVNIRKNRLYYIADILYSKLDGYGTQRFSNNEYPREVVERIG